MSDTARLRAPLPPIENTLFQRAPANERGGLSTLNHHHSLHSATSIVIHAPRERIFAIVSDLARWPERLPHYRFVRFLGKDARGRDLVQMSARRGLVPITWFSAYQTDSAKLELHFEHLRAWTKGMRVVWTLTPTSDGTLVEIVHDLKFRIPVLAWFVEPIITHGFIEPIAGRTLASFKALIEAVNSDS